MLTSKVRRVCLVLEPKCECLLEAWLPAANFVKTRRALPNAAPLELEFEGVPTRLHVRWGEVHRPEVGEEIIVSESRALAVGFLVAAAVLNLDPFSFCVPERRCASITDVIVIWPVATC